MPMTSLYVYDRSDAYEIVFWLDGIKGIYRYRHGGHGELVDYDLLPPQVQEKIYEVLNTALEQMKGQQ